MLKFVTASLSLCILLVSMAACAQSPESVAAAQTLAEKFLETHSDEELAYLAELVNTTQVHPANTVRRGFSAVSELSSDDLYNFFMNACPHEELEVFFRTGDQKYHIPVQTVVITLDRYFEDYSFEPSQVTLVAYDQQEGAFVPPILYDFGMGGANWLETTGKDILSEDIVRISVASYDRTEDPDSSTIALMITLRVKAAADGFRVISDEWERPETEN